MVIELYHVSGIMMKINIWKQWILNHVVKKFGWIKINIGGDMTMSCHVIWIHQCQYNIFSTDVFKYILVFMHVVFLLVHKYLVGYWYEYIAMAFGKELVLIFIRTLGMIVRYDYLEGVYMFIHINWKYITLVLMYLYNISDCIA